MSGLAVGALTFVATPAAADAGTSLKFTSKVAKVAGPGALVDVKCLGAAGSTCVGTLAVEAPGDCPEVSFSIEGGERRAVVVPLGDQRDLFDGILSVRTRVVAYTVQESGGSIRTARMLRFH